MGVGPGARPHGGPAADGVRRGGRRPAVGLGLADRQPAALAHRVAADADGTAQPHPDGLTDGGADPGTDRGAEREPLALAHALGVGGTDEDRRSTLRVALGGVAHARADGDPHAVRYGADVRGPDGVRDRERVRDGQREPHRPTPRTQRRTLLPTTTGVDAWVWWLIAFLVLLGGAVAAILVPRARRRRAWDDGLTEAETEARWLAEELLPQLQQAGSPDEVAGGWQVAAGRVTAAEDRLTGLETSAPDEARGARAVALRDAVRAARQGVEDLLVTRDPATLGRGLALLASRLSAALVGSRST